MYRAPEMVDLYNNYPIDERTDIWVSSLLLNYRMADNFDMEKFGEFGDLLWTRHSQFFVVSRGYSPNTI